MVKSIKQIQMRMELVIVSRLALAMLGWFAVLLFADICLAGGVKQIEKRVLCAWEPVEITLIAENSYDNPYTEVDVWVNLQGPDFNKKIWGFWDGGKIFKVRFVGIAPGEWKWTSGSTQNDSGLNGKTGSFSCRVATETEKQANPNLRGFVRVATGNRALQYADGTPFFMLADTHFMLSTWRYPWKGVEPNPNYKPAKGMGYEEFMTHMKNQGYNAISVIASFPNWDCNDGYDAKVYDDNGVPIRAAWAKPGDRQKAMDMHDEYGNRPFVMGGLCKGKQEIAANYDKINPAYWRSFDKKFRWAHDNGMLLNMESVRREHLCTWFKYYDWKVSFARYIHYLQARYGCYNQFFSLVHCDSLDFRDEKGVWVLKAKDVVEAFQYFFDRYHPDNELPFGQIVTAMFGPFSFGWMEGDPVWMDIHSVSNERHTRGYRYFKQTLKHVDKPVIHLEPYYLNWHSFTNMHKPWPDPAPNSVEDNYFARSNAWGSLHHGTVCGHVFGTGLFAGAKEPEPDEPNGSKRLIWLGLKEYTQSHRQMKYLKKYVLDEGVAWRNVRLASDDVNPNQSLGWKEDWMEYNTYMIRTEDRKLASVYFEAGSERASVKGFNRNKKYNALWLNTQTGDFIDAGVFTGPDFQLPKFPDSNGQLTLTTVPKNTDWVMKLKQL